jgi:hypothetical protein
VDFTIGDTNSDLVAFVLDRLDALAEMDLVCWDPLQ